MDDIFPELREKWGGIRVHVITQSDIISACKIELGDYPFIIIEIQAIVPEGKIVAEGMFVKTGGKGVTSRHGIPIRCLLSYRKQDIILSRISHRIDEVDRIGLIVYHGNVGGDYFRPQGGAEKVSVNLTAGIVIKD